MTDFLKIAKSIVVHFAHICAYGVETVKYNCFLRGGTYYTFSVIIIASIFGCRSLKK